MIDFGNQIINFNNPQIQEIKENPIDVLYDILKTKDILDIIEIKSHSVRLKVDENDHFYYYIILRMERPGYFVGTAGKTMLEITLEMEKRLKKPVKFSISDR